MALRSPLKAGSTGGPLLALGAPVPKPQGPGQPHLSHLTVCSIGAAISMVAVPISRSQLQYSRGDKELKESLL